MFVRVAPDVVKIEKTYWYKTTQETKDAEKIVVGSIVRVNINGRKTKGWVCEICESIDSLADSGNSIDLEKIKEVIEYVSDGPPGHIVELCESLSSQYLFSPVAFLRASSPNRIINNLSRGNLLRGSSFSKNLILVDPRADRRSIIQAHLAVNGTTLVVTPESQTKFSQWLETLGKRVVNFGLSETVTPDIYRSATRESSVIIGGRKSLFAPTSDAKSIIILDDSYEQLQEERSPQWKSIDVAVQICEQRSIPLTVISSVPTTSTYGFKTTDLRSKEPAWPKIYIDDKTKADPALGIFSREIISSIHESIKANLNCGIILNNKAASNLLSCQTCKSIAVCENCEHCVSQISEVEETFHCFNCKTERAIVCLECKGTTFKKLKKGIPSIVQECQKMFPKYRVEELKKETKTQDNHHDDIPTLYVGTEAIFHSKLLRKSLGSVIFIDFDTMLFRNSQTAFNQCLVIVNRAQRMLVKSSVKIPLILSTRVPQNPIVLDLSKNDFVSNMKRDLDLCRELKLAPFYATLKIESQTQAIKELSKTIDKEFVVGIQENGEKSSLMIRAQNHSELFENCGTRIRSFIARNRCSTSVDQYD